MQLGCCTMGNILPRPWAEKGFAVVSMPEQPETIYGPIEVATHRKR